MPSDFLAIRPESVEAASMAALLTGGRPPAKINWKFAAPCLTGTTTQWSEWISTVMKEVRSNSPPHHTASSMTWAVSAFKLELTQQQLWFIEPSLQSFDDSLALHLSSLLRGAEGTAGREFSRRIARMEDQAIGVGKTLPSRKLLSMHVRTTLSQRSFIL